MRSGWNASRPCACTETLSHVNCGRPQNKKCEEFHKFGCQARKTGEQNKKNGEQNEKNGEQNKKNGEQNKKNGEQNKKSGEQNKKSGEQNKKSGEQNKKNENTKTGEQNKKNGEQNKKSSQQNETSGQQNKKRGQTSSQVSKTKRDIKTSSQLHSHFVCLTRVQVVATAAICLLSVAIRSCTWVSFRVRGCAGFILAGFWIGVVYHY
eukprot:SAG31_NODE_2237_length_6120_cov_7.767276_2_plen_207_part_00